MTISDPRTDDRTVYAVKETDKCHNCDKNGHWAKDCRKLFIKRAQLSRNIYTGQKNEIFIAKSTIYYDIINYVARGVRKFTKFDRKPGRAYAANEDEDIVIAISDSDTEYEKPDAFERYKERTFDDDIAAFAIGDSIDK